MFDFINEIIDIKGGVLGGAQLSLKHIFPMYYKVSSPCVYYYIKTSRVFKDTPTEGAPTLFYNISMQTIFTYA